MEFGDDRHFAVDGKGPGVTLAPNGTLTGNVMLYNGGVLVAPQP